jgi:hypothetical protein
MRLLIRVFLMVSNLIGIGLSNQDLSHNVALVLPRDPFSLPEMCRCFSETTPPMPEHDQIARSIGMVGIKAIDDATMNFGVSRNVTNLASRQGPSNCFPRAIWLEVHAFEGLQRVNRGARGFQMGVDSPDTPIVASL